MTIEIKQPELVALILLRMKSGAFDSAEDVIWEAMRSAPQSSIAVEVDGDSPRTKKGLAQLFSESPFKGLDLDFERERDFGRDIEL